MSLKGKKLNRKGLISVHRSNKGDSSTYNILPISCCLHEIYRFDVLPVLLASKPSHISVTKSSSQLQAF